MAYSSLSLLRTLPISFIKVDPEFVRGVPGDRCDCAIVRALVDLGLNMALRVIAEGVEGRSAAGFPAAARLHAGAGLPVWPAAGAGCAAGPVRGGATPFLFDSNEQLP